MATVNLRIGPADNGRRMTLEEFREAEEQPGYYPGKKVSHPCTY